MKILQAPLIMEKHKKEKKKTKLNRNGDDYSTAERDLGS